MSYNVIDLRGKTITSPIVLADGDHLTNGTVLSSSGAAVECYGSLGSMHHVLSSGVDRVTVNYVGTAKKGDWMLLVADNFSPIDGGKAGQWVQVNSVSGQTIIFNAVLFQSFNIAYIPIMKRIKVSDIKFVGLKGAQYAIRAYLCKSPELLNLEAEGLEYSAYSLESCLGGDVLGCDADRADHNTGAAYGVSIVGGCHGVSVFGGRFSDLRHAVSVGGTEATARNITIHGVNSHCCSDAGIDAHPNTDMVVISGNTVIGNSTQQQTGDGICFQGKDGVISNNIIRNIRREAILVQPLTTRDSSVSVTGNVINDVMNGILVDHQSPARLTIGISGNHIAADQRKIQIQNTNGGGEIVAAVGSNIGDISVIAGKKITIGRNIGATHSSGDVAWV